MARLLYSQCFPDMDLSWKKFLRDPSHWWDNRSTKTNPRSPDFKHKLTQESLWIDDCTPFWVNEELRRRGLLLSKVKNNDASWCPGNQQDSQAFCPSFVALLKACAQSKDLCKGIKLHTDIQRRDLLERDPYVASTLINMYAKCGDLRKAQEVLDEIHSRDVVSWSALIAGYSQQGEGTEALVCFEIMQQEGHSPNSVTFICALKACSNIGAADKGKRFHDEIVQQEFLGKDIMLSNALVDMYVKCGALAKAQQVLHELPARDNATWNTLISGYAQLGKGKEALTCFEQMQNDGLSPDEIAFACALKACGSIGALDRGRQIHDVIVSMESLQNNGMLTGAVVDMYIKCGALAMAQHVLKGFSARNVFCWSALIAGFSEQKMGEEALKCFEQMHREGVSPDEVTFVCILQACGSIGAGDKGRRIHGEIVRLGLLGKDVVLGTALIDMYAKCGALIEAQQVLDELPVRDVVTWNVLIAGYAQQVQDEEVLNCFEWMQDEGVSPNVATFACVLSICSRLALVHECEMYLSCMSRKHGMTVGLEHYTCMVDLLSRAGHFDEAIMMIARMPDVAFLPVWSALLSACQRWGNVEIGKWAFNYSFKHKKDGAEDCAAG